MKLAQAPPNLTMPGLRNFMILSSIAPGAVAAREVFLLIAIKRWFGLTNVAIWVLSLALTYYGLYYLLRVLGSRAEGEAIGLRLPALVVIGIGVIQVFASIDGLSSLELAYRLQQIGSN